MSGCGRTDSWMGKEVTLLVMTSNACSYFNILFYGTQVLLKKLFGCTEFTLSSVNQTLRIFKYYVEESREPGNHLYPVECVECSCCGHERRFSLQYVHLTLSLFLGHFGLNGCHLIREESTQTLVTFVSISNR